MKKAKKTSKKASTKVKPKIKNSVAVKKSAPAKKNVPSKKTTAKAASAKVVKKLPGKVKSSRSKGKAGFEDIGDSELPNDKDWNSSAENEDDAIMPDDFKGFDEGFFEGGAEDDDDEF